MWGVGEHFLRPRWPRLAEAALGLWLMASIAVFPHESSSDFDTLMLGLLVISNAVQALWAPFFRFWNAALGLYMLVMEAVFPHASAGRMLSVLAAAGAILVLSFVPSPSQFADPLQPAVGYRP
jgi:hypothetical protein